MRGASFFYLDRLLLLAAGGAVRLYAYHLQRTPTSDASRAPELRHKYKLAHAWQMPRAQHVTCFASANSFLSPLVLAAGSDRSLCALDLGVGKAVLTLSEVRHRP